jgi:hypothetical protein
MVTAKDTKKECLSDHEEENDASEKINRSGQKVTTAPPKELPWQPSHIIE